MTKGKTRNWTLIILVLLSLYLFSAFLANMISVFETEEVAKGNVAIIPIRGIIMADEPEKSLIETTTGTSSTGILKMIKKAKEDDKIKAVIFEINSPGGSAVASEEISLAIKDMNKTSVAWIREVGASGAYWAASATDHIVTSRMSATGSIGVLSSYLEFAELIERFNITYKRLVSGKYKDAGSPFRELTPEEERKKLDQLRKVHDYFIQSVADNRNMSFEDVKVLAEGEVYLGEEALRNGLVDEIGGKKEAIAFIEKELNLTAETVRYEKRKTLADVFSSLTSNHGYHTGLGYGESMVVKT